MIKRIVVFGVLLLAATASVITPVQANPLLQDGDESCAVSAFGIEGQKRYSFAPLTGVASGVSDVDSAELQSVPLLGNAPDTVVIVIDDFTIDPLGTGTHGAYVVDVIRRSTNYTVTPITIDIADAGYTASGIADELVKILDMYPDVPLVINMSFAFVPCDYFGGSNTFVNIVEKDFTEGLTLRHYIWREVLLYGDDPTDADLYSSDVDNALNELLNAEPDNAGDFRNLLHEIVFGERYGRVALVGAAGNFGLVMSEPTYPARWDEVISVSAFSSEFTTDTGDRTMFVANPGEVQLAGGWYELFLNTDQFLIGTSFAAPLVAARIAVHFAEGFACPYTDIVRPFDNIDLATWMLDQCGAGPIAYAPSDAVDYNLPAEFNLELEAGFLPEPVLQVVMAGGPLDASQVGCFGSIKAAPSLQLTYSGNAANLRIWARSSTDTVLAINTPSGNWVCDDDSGENLNPLIDFPNADSGIYDIYVGTYSGGVVSAEVGITELDITP